MAGAGTTTQGATGRMDRTLERVERAGNRLPDPFMLFWLLFLVVGVVSTGLALAGTEVRLPGADEPVVVQGLFTGEGMTWFTTNLGGNFIGFPPLKTVVTILLAVTVAERTGLLGAGIRVVLGSAPRWALPYAVGLVGVFASVMADAALIVVPPLAAMVFKAGGRHPVAGLMGGFAAAGAGYSTALVPTSPRRVLRGHHHRGVPTVPTPGAAVNPVSNYWFNITSSLVLSAIVAGCSSTVSWSRG